MKIGIYGYPVLPENKDFILQFCKYLKEFDAEVYIFDSFFQFLKNDFHFNPEIKGFFSDYSNVPPDLDIMFSIGGDGTVLETVSIIRNKGIPIAGINSGRLGFLANISKVQLEKAVKKILQKDFTIENRALLELRSNSGIFSDFNIALNEITVHKKDSASMIAIDTFVNNELLTTYWADGLIISTPTGSTAYSLSVGGPIVVPQSQNVILSPIAPHNLTMRPIVLPDDIEIRLRVHGRDNSFLVSLDYRSEDFDGNDELIIRRANYDIQMVKLPDASFYKTIRTKMMWGVDKRNRN